MDLSPTKTFKKTLYREGTFVGVVPLQIYRVRNQRGGEGQSGPYITESHSDGEV